MSDYSINPKYVFDADTLPTPDLVTAIRYIREESKTKYEFFKLNGHIYFITKNCCHQTSLPVSL